jgi:adenylosuccinate synthase
MVDVLLGLQWGDEGKGKVVDYLAPKYALVVRFQGGPNAGHTLILEGKKYVLHTVPSGIFRESMLNLIGNGVVLDPITFCKELDNLNEAGIEFISRLFISRKAHLILPTHRYLDAASEASKGKNKIGSTLRGIGPTYMDKTGRNGLRIGDIESPSFCEKYNSLKEKHLKLVQIYGQDIEFDLDNQEKLWFESIERLKTMQLVNGEYFVNKILDEGKHVLAEGAQGSMLDVDFGTYPFVTSSNTTSAGVCSGIGIAPQRIGEVYGVIKAYCTRVGAGPFPTELHDDMGEKLRAVGKEFGATTGRPRRCGWIDIPQIKYTIMINGVTQLVMTKIDVLDQFDEISVCDGYQMPDGEVLTELPYDLCDQDITPQVKTFKGWNKDLTQITSPNDFPAETQHYIESVEKMIGTPLKMISVGPGREQLIVR